MKYMYRQDGTRVTVPIEGERGIQQPRNPLQQPIGSKDRDISLTKTALQPSINEGESFGSWLQRTNPRMWQESRQPYQKSEGWKATMKRLQDSFNSGGTSQVNPLQEPTGFRQISPGLGVAEVPVPQIDPETGQPLQQQAQPLPQPPQLTGNSIIDSKIRSLYEPLPQQIEQVGMRRKIFRILPIKKRRKFSA